MLQELEQQAWERAGRAKGRAFIKEAMDLSKHDETPVLIQRAINYAVDAFALGADPGAFQKLSSPAYVPDYEQGLEDAREEIIEILSERF